MNLKLVSWRTYRSLSVFLLISLVILNFGGNSNFIAQAQQSGWTTYQTSKYGYQLEYPLELLPTEHIQSASQSSGVPSDVWFGQYVHVISRIPAFEDEFITRTWNFAESIQLDNVNALRTERITESNINDKKSIMIEYLIRGNGADYIIVYEGSDAGNSEEMIQRQLFEKMVASFNLLPTFTYDAPAQALIASADGFDFFVDPPSGGTRAPSYASYNTKNPYLTDTSTCYNKSYSQLQHTGEDWFRNPGTKIYAAANGRVIYIHPYTYPGNVIIVEHTLVNGWTNPWGGNIIYSVYAHVDATVTQWSDVTKGQVLGTVMDYPGDGNNHSHFEMRKYGDMSNILKCPSNNTGTWPGPGYTNTDVNPDIYGYTNPSAWIDAHRSQGTSCPAPSLNSPSDGYISSNQTASFSWSAVGGCTFNGYTFRIKDVSTMDSGGNLVDGIDHGVGGTSTTETISSQWNNRDLYWGVRAANAPNGANWSVRRFRIEPSSANSPVITLNLGNTLKNRPVTIELRYPLFDQLLPAPFTWSTTTDANGNIINFTLTGASPGTTYNLLVKPQGWLRKQRQITLTQDSNSVDFQSSFTNSAGDTNGNNKVDILDFQVLSNEFGTTGISHSDLNGDGRTDILDFQLLSNGFGKVGDGGEIITAGTSVALSSVNDTPGQLTLVPSTNTPRVGDVITLNLDYDTATLPMAALDAMIDYDQCVLQPVTDQITDSGIFATTAKVSTPGTLEYEGLKWTGVTPGPSVSGTGRVASIPFKIITSVPTSTTISIRFRSGSTYLSNMAQDNIVHPFLGNVGNIVLHPTGIPQRASQTARITSPVSGATIHQNFVLFQAQVSDACNGIHQVIFSVFYDGQWHRVSAYKNGTDRWAVYWDASRVSDQVIKVKAFVGDFAGNGIDTAVAENILIDRSPDEKDTTGVFRPSNGALYLKNQNNTGIADIQINYGLGGDYPIVGDWDGNGTATIGVYRNGSFYLRNSNDIGFADIVFPFGAPGDQPIAGDWNDDGIDTIGVYRSSNITFYLRNSNTAGPPDYIFQLGTPGDIGIAGDWDKDGKDTTGVFRPSNGALYLKNTNSTGIADIQINYGLPGDKPVTGDWNNDGIDTIGVYRNGTFYLRNSNNIGFADIVFDLGVPGDMPIAGNWDGIP